MRILDLLLPPACAGCGRSGSLLCDGCRHAMRAPSDPEDRFVVAEGGTVIGDAFVAAIAGFAFEGSTRRALSALKYSGATRLAPILAEALDPTLGRLLAVTGPADLVPIPLHAERRASRGYNQAELIASWMARRHGLAVVHALKRIRPTTKQHRLNRVARLQNLRGAFRARGRAPPTVILVDDIITTTATLEACATVLRQAGASDVFGIAVAREV
jgi:ComF family protein